MSDFRKDVTGVAQTAANTAATLTAAFINAGIITSQEDADSYFGSRYAATLAELSPIVAADNEVFAAAQAAGGSKGKSWGSNSGSTRPSGGQGGSHGTVTAEDARSVVLSFGKFKGTTLGEVEGLNKAQTAEYGYETGDGKVYLTWLSKNENNTFIADRALAILGASA